MMKHYVVCIHADREPGDVNIVGPFESNGYAAAWGHRWQERNGDNPCWNTVALPDGFVPTISAPTR